MVQDKVDVAALMQAVAELTRRLEAEEEEGRRLRDKVSASEDEDAVVGRRQHARTRAPRAQFTGRVNQGRGLTVDFPWTIG